MRILYGVQGTGNGHLSRARVMAKALMKQDIEVDFLFRGVSLNSFSIWNVLAIIAYKRA